MKSFTFNFDPLFIIRSLKNLPAQMPIRDGFIYDNYMFDMLAQIIEELGEGTWENVITYRIRLILLQINWCFCTVNVNLCQSNGPLYLVSSALPTY